MDTSVLIVFGIVFLFAVLMIVAFFAFLKNKPNSFKAELDTRLGKANLEAEMRPDPPAQPEQAATTEPVPAPPPLADGTLDVEGVKAGRGILVEHNAGGGARLHDLDAQDDVLISTSNPGTAPKAPPPA
jgi:hypothetical protein